MNVFKSIQEHVDEQTTRKLLLPSAKSLFHKTTSLRVGGVDGWCGVGEWIGVDGWCGVDCSVVWIVVWLSGLWLIWVVIWVV